MATATTERPGDPPTTTGHYRAHAPRPFTRAERDSVTIRAADANQNFVYLTAGSCGACRFGQYHQSYELTSSTRRRRWATGSISTCRSRSAAFSPRSSPATWRER
jgi:hypothetical protein